MDGFDPKTSFDYETSKRYDALETRGDEEDTVAVLAQLAGQQDALEFAVGTGRIDSPLVRAGVPVDGIEQSQHMVDRMREQPDGDNVNVVIGDLSRVSTGRRYGLVYCRGSPGPAARVRPAGAGQTLITRRILWAAAMRSSSSSWVTTGSPCSTAVAAIRACEFDHPVDAGGFAICDESRPADHDGLADRDRVGCPSERERVGPTRATCGIGRVENTELKLADRDNRYRYAVG